MYLRRSATVKYFVAAYVGAALYCEWFVYLLQPVYWNNLECQSGDRTCTKILFIADPQIQGEDAVPPPLSFLFNWDSDRYLKSTFSIAIRHFKPDVLVYMGDLMDEGSISTMPQFHRYVKRLADIFEVNYSVMQVWVPGDNDIGGEGEPIKKYKIVEFEKIFDQPSIVTFKNISFYKVNGISYSIPDTNERLGDTNLKVVVSHYPITVKQHFAQQVDKAIRPDIYFCAHEHKSRYIKQNKDWSHRELYWLDENDAVLNMKISDDYFYEIYVPTCSYRMGTSKIGYGAAVIENNNENIRYTVFWSSTRFPILFFYLALLIIVILYAIVFCAARLCLRRSKTSGASRTDKLPLLDRIKLFK